MIVVGAVIGAMIAVLIWALVAFTGHQARRHQPTAAPTGIGDAVQLNGARARIVAVREEAEDGTVRTQVEFVDERSWIEERRGS
jgi:hypothetical protein